MGDQEGGFRGTLGSFIGAYWSILEHTSSFWRHKGAQGERKEELTGGYAGTKGSAGIPEASLLLSPTLPIAGNSLKTSGFSTIS